jgi:hypothetical protein
MVRHRHTLAVVAALSFVATLSLPVAARADVADPAATVEEPAAETTAPEPSDPAAAEPADPVDPAAAEPADPVDPAPTEPVDPEPEPTEPTPTDIAGTPPPEPLDTPPPAEEEAAVQVAGTTSSSAQRSQEKVTICHRTNSRTNPYNQIVVSQESAIEGHASHIGPIFSPDVDNWGDIIPPIRPGLPRGRNWPEGQAVLDNGCEVPPDVGPLPAAAISDVTCAEPDASVSVTVRNGAAATDPATFTILVDGNEVQTVGPVPSGASEEVVLSAPVSTLEDQTFTIEVRSGGETIATRVVTVDCDQGPPAVEIGARLACAGTAAQGTATVTNNGQAPVAVTGQVDGVSVGDAVVVDPGATETGTVDLSPYEDQTVVVTLLVDGTEVAAYTVTPDCVEPQVAPRVAVAGAECPPPSTTVTLANDGDPDSKIVFSIRVDDKVVQVSAPIYGGDSTTIVGDLSRYEDQTVDVELRANGEVLGSRTVAVDCEPDGGRQVPAGAAEGDTSAPAVPTVVPAGVGPAGGADADGPPLGAVGLLVLGGLLLLVGGRPRRRTTVR